MPRDSSNRSLPQAHDTSRQLLQLPSASVPRPAHSGSARHTKLSFHSQLHSYCHHLADCHLSLGDTAAPCPEQPHLSTTIMSQTKTLKVRVTLFFILVGGVLAMVAVVTDHWALLSPHLEHHNETCEAAHFGLWRICTTRVAVRDKEDKNCERITLSGEKNCSYFRHFNPGESSEIFEFTTQKEYSISAAAIAIFSLGFIIVGSICAFLSFGNKRDYLLRPASMFYAFAGLCLIVSVEVMRQSVKRMIDSEDTVWIEYYYSWSFACACAAFTLLFLGGLFLLLFSLPRMPQNPWESCMDAEPEH